MKNLSCIVLVFLAGCSFRRSVVNDYVRDMDTSWIEPGITTRDDVVSRLGVSPSDKEGGGITPTSFRWVCSDTFTKTFEAGYIVTPTFEHGHQHFAEDILILFDDQGVVKLLSRTRGDGDKNRIVEWKEARRK